MSSVDPGLLVELLVAFWPHVAVSLTLICALWASGHAVVCKRDPRAALWWVTLIWVVPVAGAVGAAFFMKTCRIFRHASLVAMKINMDISVFDVLGDDSVVVAAPALDALDDVSPLSFV